MKAEIIQQPFAVKLVGFSERVTNGRYGEIGLRLMDSMWKEIGDRELPSKGMNHWVYLPDGVMFTGVELKQDTSDIGLLKRLSIQMTRYVRHVHVGPYSNLPATWTALKERIVKLGETISSPGLEIYGHWCQDESKLETTILISLEPGKIEHLS
jgi:hypothetical protein